MVKSLELVSLDNPLAPIQGDDEAYGRKNVKSERRLKDSSMTKCKRVADQTALGHHTSMNPTSSFHRTQTPFHLRLRMTIQGFHHNTQEWRNGGARELTSHSSENTTALSPRGVP
ncbi:hypothetical protein K469DRAFT_106509 [Zopfia rhizophila CBS 207.26]|uniref:Uncharacterized protein n=1 Tax=Zopfia rhizophila CBS 207.26 TaxID=1314779 RepID=A0A6A6E9D8_9PEZI|nr:hypothetical protein K469DRAFT_106509 [Zopfia rhizophila CBS 207.26]